MAFDTNANITIKKSDGWVRVDFELLSNIGQHKGFFQLKPTATPPGTDEKGHPLLGGERLDYSRFAGSIVYIAADEYELNLCVSA